MSLPGAGRAAEVVKWARKTLLCARETEEGKECGGYVDLQYRSVLSEQAWDTWCGGRRIVASSLAFAPPPTHFDLFDERLGP